MNTHETLMRLTATMPMKQIDVSGKPYLQRYFVSESEQGQLWLHRFMSADGERHVHSHPWTGTSMILCGEYTEQRMVSRRAYELHDYWPGQINEITPDTLHRIVSVQPDTWTLLHIKPGRRETWSFFEDDGSEVVMRASEESWWRNHGVRSDA